MSENPARKEPEEAPEDAADDAARDADTRRPGSTSIVRVGGVRHTVMAVRQPDNPIVERMRRLAMQLMVGRHAADSKVLAVVSPDSGDGRSFLAANLAVLFAQAGRRTLLIDGDLRSPVQHELFDATNTKGLSNLARGRADWSVVQPVDSLPGMYIIPAGPAVSNPGEIISRSTLSDILVELQRPCDQIVIDTPPGSVFADAEAIAAHAGSAIMLLKRNTSRIKDAKRLNERLQASGTLVIGSILNHY